MRRSVPTGRGFTLVELLVVIAITGILISLMLPAVQSSREAARRLLCQHQLRQLGLALQNYHGLHSVFPAGSYVQGPSFPVQTGWGWGAMLLPYVEQSAIYGTIDFNVGTSVGGNRQVILQPISLWRCPSDIGPDRMPVVPVYRPSFEIASGNYCGVEGILRPMSRMRFADITDGTSQTLILGERVVQPSVNGSLPHTAGWFGQIAFTDGYEYRSVPHLPALGAFPINGSRNSPYYFSSRHTSGATFVFADGSVRLLSDNLDATVFEALGTPGGGEIVDSF